MRETLSPEEKLLRLIRGQKKVAKPVQPAQVQVYQIKKQEFYRIAPRIFNLENAQKALLVIFIISCVYLLISLIYLLFIPKNTPLVKIDGGNAPAEKITFEIKAKPYEFYSEAVRNRRLFGGIASQNAEGAAPIILGNELIKDINLIGIVSGDNPQAVIEDKRAQKTYYVSKNQFISQFQVEDIQEGKIILNSNGQKFELYL
ncbi:MAG: hypothetical protein Q7K98_05440 [Candidatus Omnitrophota bacterium]|nr:hypothetical protein [Candidatus Omnitrophota bacterium]